MFWNLRRKLCSSRFLYSFWRFSDHLRVAQTSPHPFVYPALSVQDPLCTPALRTLGNMVSGQETWADAVMVHNEFLPCLAGVLASQVLYSSCTAVGQSINQSISLVIFTLLYRSRH